MSQPRDDAPPAGGRRTRIWGARPFARHVVNPLARRVAGWLPGFGVVTCRGRASGRTYRIPLNVFVSGGTYTFVLTYGSDAQWVKNVLAAGGCSLRTRRRDVRLADPELADDPRLDQWPGPRFARFLARSVGAREYLRLRAVPGHLDEETPRTP